MHDLKRVFPTLSAALAVVLAGGCTAIGQYHHAVWNQPLQAASAASAPAPVQASLTVPRDRRGNGKVLMYLALSGGGSRAAYLSAATLHALEAPDIGLLQEVDAVSAVSGGSLAAAYHAASRDAELRDPALRSRLEALRPAPAGLQTRPSGALSCTQALSGGERQRLAAQLSGPDLQRLEQLCLAGHYPRWDRDETLRVMKKNYLLRWVGNLLLPQNLARYWFTSFDRSDIMARTLANSALGRSGLFSDDITLGELNPLRPQLIISATNATQEALPRQAPAALPGCTVDGNRTPMPFGSQFTFTDQDFRFHLQSDIGSFPLARAVMASSAYPLAFATMTLEDFGHHDTCLTGDGAMPNPGRRFMHLIDGGNADNLGLRAVKRSLLEMHAAGRLEGYDRVVVLLVDAFTTPAGTPRYKPDPRSVFDLLLDTNVNHAVDALLQANRQTLLDDFDTGELHYGRDCELLKNALRHFPKPLCDRLPHGGEGARRGRDRDRFKLDLSDKLVFFHFGFADVVRPGDDKSLDLKAALDQIGTSFSISDDTVSHLDSFYVDGYAQPASKESETDLIERAVATVIRPDHPCIGALSRLVKQPTATPQDVLAARGACSRADLRR